MKKIEKNDFPIVNEIQSLPNKYKIENISLQIMTICELLENKFQIEYDEILLCLGEFKEIRNASLLNSQEHNENINININSDEIQKSINDAPLFSIPDSDSFFEESNINELPKEIPKYDPSIKNKLFRDKDTIFHFILELQDDTHRAIRIKKSGKSKNESKRLIFCCKDSQCKFNE